MKNGTREVNSFIVYPETNKKATAVVVIHEIFGMSDWVQQITDELAEAGYIAIAPDLAFGHGTERRRHGRDCGHGQQCGGPGDSDSDA